LYFKYHQQYTILSQFDCIFITNTGCGSLHGAKKTARYHPDGFGWQCG
jgi:hypothetical protein